MTYSKLDSMTVAEMIEKLLNVEDTTLEVRAAVMREFPDLKRGTSYVTDRLVTYEIKKIAQAMSLPDKHKTITIGFEIPVTGETPPEALESKDTVH